MSKMNSTIDTSAQIIIR